MNNAPYNQRPNGAVVRRAGVRYLTGAVITVVRARSYAHIPFPLVYAAPVAASLVVL